MASRIIHPGAHRGASDSRADCQLWASLASPLLPRPPLPDGESRIKCLHIGVLLLDRLVWGSDVWPPHRICCGNVLGESQKGGRGDADTIPSNFLTGENITLTLSYNPDLLSSIVWYKDTDKLAKWDKQFGPKVIENEDRTFIIKIQTLVIINSTRSDSGNYRANVSYLDELNQKQWRETNFPVKIYDTENLSGGALAGVVIGSILGAILLIALLVILIFCIRKRKNGKAKKSGGPQVKKDPDIYTVNNLMYSNPSISQSADIKMSKNRLPSDDQTSYTMNNLTSRSSTFSDSSVIRDPGDNMSQHTSPTPNPPSGPPKIKRVTQI